MTLLRWVQGCTPELIDAARPYRHAVGVRWFVDETYVMVNDIWRYVSGRWTSTARCFFTASLLAHRTSAEVITDRDAALANVTSDLIKAAFHHTGQYANNRCEADHGKLKARLRETRDLLTDQAASILTGGHGNTGDTSTPSS